ncbi:hypothetical protein HU200_039823 [Digitaria exilis]|uniref:Pectinesterase inhibitor domain-containing protein n=1 Tax=Digitaria exilis TaxID=1010633 RepID=A0A835B8P2_9POAL|nr:hypothetical protein HU200_039823 [Digitaria exilis]
MTCLSTRLILAAAAAAAVVLCCCGVASAAGDTVADSCAAIRDFVDASFCEARLRSVPGAATADRHGHLLMAADLAAASGATAGDAAARLASAPGDPAAQDALRACGFLYGSASVPALRLMRGYAAARSWGAARSLLMLTGYAGNGCDAALGGGGGAKGKTMAGVDREFHQLSAMATALLNAVANGGR